MSNASACDETIMDYSRIRTELTNKRSELISRLNKLNRDVHHRDQPFDPNFTEQAIELQNLDVLFELDEGSRHELNQINNALERLDNKEYEICVVCGEPIGSNRLAALPYAETCIKCANR